MVEANRVSWVKRLLQSKGKWTLIVRNIFLPITLEHLIECNLDESYLKNIHNPFYKQILFYWNCIKKSPLDRNDFRNQILWNNKYITLPIGPKHPNKSKTIFWQRFYKAGIIRVEDLFINNKFINVVQLFEKYKIRSNFITLHTLKKAIPLNYYYYYYLFVHKII